MRRHTVFARYSFFQLRSQGLSRGCLRITLRRSPIPPALGRDHTSVPPGPGARTAIYKIHTNERLHHSTHANFVALPPVRLLLRLLALTPPAGLKTVRYVGAYAGALRARGGSGPPSPTPSEPKEADPPHAASSMWARLLHRVFEVAPLLCPCGSVLRLKSFVTADTELVRLLHYLDLPTELPTTTRSRAPPPVEQPELFDAFDQAASM